MPLPTLHTVALLRETVTNWRANGQRVALVPTMGNLHAGHLRLVETARRQADRVVASVFVNPLQFGPSEDFDRYPRTLEADATALATAGCDALFAPSAREVYPRGLDGLVRVVVPEALATVLCGAFRPGHFDGVATVVNILFNMVAPDLALFGEKDYQQLAVIRRMVADLHLPVRVEGVPTERAADGLALSSRNQYLSATERLAAPAMHAALAMVGAGLRAGRRDFAALAHLGTAQLTEAGMKPQYLEIRALDLSVPAPDDAGFVVLAAAYLGATRLIDNLSVQVRNGLADT